MCPGLIDLRTDLCTQFGLELGVALRQAPNHADFFIDAGEWQACQGGANFDLVQCIRCHQIARLRDQLLGYIAVGRERPAIIKKANRYRLPAKESVAKQSDREAADDRARIEREQNFAAMAKGRLDGVVNDR